MKIALYRHFDADGRLLYVGISSALLDRTAQHMRSSRWAEQIATISVEWFDSRDAAASAERDAIRSGRPLHNRTNVRPQAYPRQGWNGEIAHPDLMQDVLAFCERTGLSKGEVGKRSVNDPALIYDIEKGRELRRDTISAVRRFMVTGQPRKGAA